MLQGPVLNAPGLFAILLTKHLIMPNLIWHPFIEMDIGGGLRMDPKSSLG